MIDQLDSNAFNIACPFCGVRMAVLDDGRRWLLNASGNLVQHRVSPVVTDCRNPGCSRGLPDGLASLLRR